MNKYLAQIDKSQDGDKAIKNYLALLPGEPG